MTQLDEYASALRRMSRDLLVIATTERRWDCQDIRSHAQTLDRIAFDLLFDSDPQD